MTDRIAVLGAGPMGLAVAYQLVLDGYKPILFEADDRVGGMTATFDFDGLSIERFYHFHCISDADFLKLLKELSIDNRMRWVETRMGYWFQDRVQPWGNPIALLKFRGLGWIAKFRYGLHAFLTSKRDHWKPLDRLEASNWIQRWVGNEAWEILWRRLFDYKFYNYSDQLSAAWIWSRIRRIGRSRYDLFREKLGYLEGGSDTLLAALSQEIRQRGGDIHLSQPVTRVILKEGHVAGIEVAGRTEYFDKVISTIPLPFIPRIIPDLPDTLLDRYRAVKNIAVVCVIVKLKKRLTENFWLNTNDPEMDIPGLVEYTNLRTLSSHIVYVPFYMPGEHAKFQDPDEVFKDKVRRYLKKINRDISEEEILAIHVSRYRYAQPVCGPGFLDKLPPARTEIKGLWVADTSYYYPEDRGISESIGYGRQLARQATQS